ncbi:MAG TPA: TolC family protein [Kiritimatiellia bacterium]|nr:TolC family protein [Kiritimatiellia bacterium]
MVFVGVQMFLAPVHGQDLNAWLDAIDDENPRVIAARAKWRAAEAMINQIAGLPDPMIGVDMMRDTSTRFSDYAALEYMVEQELPWFGRRGMARDVALLEAEAMGYEMLEVRRQVRATIVAATWDLWAARQSLEVAHEQVRLTEALAGSVRSRLEAGQAAQSDWLRVKIEAERLLNDAVTMERDVEVALARLNTQLNADPDTPRSTDIMPPLPEWNLSLQQLKDDTRQYSGILMATFWREMARDLARKSARLEQRPSLSFVVKARQFRESGSIEEYDTGVAMNFPWLWRGKYQARRAEAEADYRMASADLEAETSETLFEIQELYTEAESRLRTMRLYEEKILPSVRSMAESAREAYPAGMMSAMEMIDAQRMTLESEMIYLKEQAAYASAYAKLMAIAQPWTPDEFDFGLPLHEGGRSDEK